MNKKLKTTGANWRLNLDVYCPYCENIHYDVIDEYEPFIDEWRDHFDKIPGTEKGLNIEMKCEECEKDFIITETEY